MTHYEYLKQRTANVARVIDLLRGKSEEANITIRLLEFEQAHTDAEIEKIRAQAESDVIGMMDTVVRNPEMFTPKIRGALIATLAVLDTSGANGPDDLPLHLGGGCHG